MGCMTAVNTKTHQAERTRGRTKEPEGQEGAISLHWVFRHKIKTWHRRLLQLDVNADRFGSAVAGSPCKCRACGGKPSPSLPRPGHFVPVLFPFPLSSTDAVSDCCCLSLRQPRGREQPRCCPSPGRATLTADPGGSWLQARLGTGSLLLRQQHSEAKHAKGMPQSPRLIFWVGHRVMEVSDLPVPACFLWGSGGHGGLWQAAHLQLGQPTTRAVEGAETIRPAIALSLE